MENFTNKIEKFLLPISEKISGNKSLQSVSKGFMLILSVTMIGSIFYLIANFPIPAWTAYLAESGLGSTILIGYNVTVGLLAIYTTIAISYAYADNRPDSFPIAIIATICFFIITPFTTGEAGSLSYDFNWLSSKGIFVGILTAIVVAKSYIFIVDKGWSIKMPDGVPPFVEQSFASLIPGFILTFSFIIIAQLFQLTSFGNIHEFIFMILQKPLYALGGSLAGYLISQVLIALLWWFGIHGFNVVMSVMMPIYLGIDMARLAGETTNPIGMSLMTVVGQATISAVIVLIFFCKSKQLKQVGKIALPASVFNIGEPVVFGVPNVMNPYMFIPNVLLIPIVLNLFFYFGFTTGILPPLSGAQVSMQVPVVIYGLVQGNYMVALWQLLAIPLAVAMFLPFYKMYDKKLVEKENLALAESSSLSKEGL